MRSSLRTNTVLLLFDLIISFLRVQSHPVESINAIVAHPLITQYSFVISVISGLCTRHLHTGRLTVALNFTWAYPEP